MNNISEEDLVNFKYVMGIIEDQFEQVMQTDQNYYKNYKFEISNEQFWVSEDDREANTIYIIIRFSPADIDYGQLIMPFTIQAISEENGLSAAQRLLLEYAQYFNLTIKKDDINNKIIYQSYTTPTVSSNYEIVYDGFRSIFMMSGSILLSKNINRTTLKYYNGDYAKFDLEQSPENLEQRIKGSGNFDELVDVDIFTVKNDSSVYVWNNNTNKYEKSDGEDLDILTFTDQYNASPDTQPYFEKKNFTCSIVKYGTYSFTISSFLIDDVLTNKVLNILSRKINPNTNFYFKIVQDNGYNMPLLEYKLINVGKTQQKGQMPSIALTFTN